MESVLRADDRGVGHMPHGQYDIYAGGAVQFAERGPLADTAEAHNIWEVVTPIHRWVVRHGKSTPLQARPAGE